MKLAVSNIAWQDNENEAVAAVLQSNGVAGIELALAKHWNDPLGVSDEEARDWAQWWRDRHLPVVAFQSMLFPHPELQIIQSDEDRSKALSILKRYIELAGIMGAGALVFGSPKNRRKEEKTFAEAVEIVQPFFRSLGKHAQEHGVVFCLEPNAPQYQCDFVTTTDEALTLIAAVDSPGFALHLDTACASLAGESLSHVVKQGASQLRHFHASSPMLELVEQRSDVNHMAAATALSEIGYDGYVSIEMRPGETGQNVARVESAVGFIQSIYADR